MKAIVFERYGSTNVLELQDVEAPHVGDDGVLVQVQAAAINPYDWHFMTGLPYFLRLQLGLRRPRINGFGSDLAGRVEAVGPKVTRFRPGDEVYGRVDLAAGSTLMDLGSLAEYVRVSEDSIRPRPARLTAEEAAAVPLAGITALWAIRDTRAVQRGQHVLINGASGGVGTFAVQIAKALGAEVTGVCSTRNVDGAAAARASGHRPRRADRPDRGRGRHPGRRPHLPTGRHAEGDRVPGRAPRQRQGHRHPKGGSPCSSGSSSA